MEEEKSSQIETVEDAVIISSESSSNCTDSQIADKEKEAMEKRFENKHEKEIYLDEEVKVKMEEEKAVQAVTGCPECDRGKILNCSECCDVVKRHCEKFGYQVDVACECHDICVQDVKLICVKHLNISIPIAGRNGAFGCRGLFEIDGEYDEVNCRVFCAEEELVLEGPDRCLVVKNEVGVQASLTIKRLLLSDMIFVHEHVEKFDCRFTDFYRFPDGTGFPNTKAGREAFKEIIRFIDGSCKVVIIERCEIVTDENLEPGELLCPRVEIDLKVIDKLWKHENLLVSALKPYPENITVKDEFNDLHQIGGCPPPCPR